MAAIFNQSQVNCWPAAFADVKVKQGFYKWEVKSAVRFSYFSPSSGNYFKDSSEVLLSYRTARGVANKFYK